MTNQDSISGRDRHLRVLIVDDMPQVRQELRVLLELTGELHVVGEAASALEAVNQAWMLRPDVVVMDLELMGLDGCEATREIKTRRLAGKVVMWSVHAGLDDVRRAHQAGADIFIDKGARYETLLSAILADRQSIPTKEEDI
jgi:DNA-binding NarL/FixJ family response regulator